MGSTVRYIVIICAVMMSMGMAKAESLSAKKAVFAGGCFWCLQPGFDHTKGVLSTTVGYTGGRVPHPSYEAVCTGSTGHMEAIEVLYDPAVIPYASLVDLFLRSIDPTDDGGQFSDRGSQYQTAIFYADEDQRRVAEGALKKLGVSGKFNQPIVTRILPAAVFYPAEEYHQKYYLKQSARYKAYKDGSGRTDFLKSKW